MGVVVSGLVGLGRKIRVQQQEGSSAEPGGQKPRGAVPKDAPPQMPSLPGRSRLYEMEAELEEQMRPEVVRELERQVQRIAAETDGRPGRPECPKCSRPMQSKDPHAKRSLRTAGGKLTFHRHAWWCSRCQVSRYPADEVLGLPAVERWTPLTLSRLGSLTTIVPFEQSEHLANSLLGVEVSKKGMWQIAQRLGLRLERYREEQAAACGDARSSPDLPSRTAGIPQVAADGAMVLMRADQAPEASPAAQDEDPLEEESRRRCRGREVKTAVVTMPVGPPPSGEQKVRRVRRLLVSVLGTADQLWSALWSAMVLAGLAATDSPVAIIGDGAKWIWERAKLFPNRIEILDFWHAAEHAWTCARVLWGEGSAQTKRWARRIRRLLRAGKVQKVIKELRALRLDLQQRGARASAIEALDKLIGYYVEHASRMNYPRYRALGLSIGSGAVESAHRQVVHVRMRQAGMRWSVRGAQRMVLLREAYVRGAWGDVERLCSRRAA